MSVTLTLHCVAEWGGEGGGAGGGGGGDCHICTALLPTTGYPMAHEGIQTIRAGIATHITWGYCT